MRRPDKGFTIIELMVTVAIASVLTMIAVPSFINMVRNNRIAGQTNEFITVLSLGRAEAVKRQRPVVLCRSSDAESASEPTCYSGTRWSDGWMLFVDLNNDGDYDGDPETIIATHGPLSGGNRLEGNNNVANRVTFLPTGVVGAGGIGRFLLQDSRGQDAEPGGACIQGTRLLCLGMTGRARMYRNGWLECAGESQCPN